MFCNNYHMNGFLNICKTISISISETYNLYGIKRCSYLNSGNNASRNCFSLKSHKMSQPNNIINENNSVLTKMISFFTGEIDYNVKRNANFFAKFYVSGYHLRLSYTPWTWKKSCHIEFYIEFTSAHIVCMCNTFGVLNWEVRFIVFIFCEEIKSPFLWITHPSIR